MFCESFIDRKWAKTMERRKRDIQTLESMRKIVEKERGKSEETAVLTGSSGSENETDDRDFQNPMESESQKESTEGKKHKRRKIVLDKITMENDPLPQKYQHLRESIRKGRPAVYESMDKMKSQLHMSDSQAAGAIVISGNKLFDRNWILHSECKKNIDVDTLPQTLMVRQAGRDIEAVALDEIVREIMNSDKKTVVTYNDDGSKKQGTGSFTVQGLTIKGNMPLEVYAKNLKVYLNNVTSVMFDDFNSAVRSLAM